MSFATSITTAPVLRVDDDAVDIATIDERTMAVLIHRILSAFHDSHPGSPLHTMFTRIHGNKDPLSVAANMVNVMVHTCDIPIFDLDTPYYMVEPSTPRSINHAAVTYMELTQCTYASINKWDRCSVDKDCMTAARAIAAARTRTASIPTHM